MTWPTNAIRWIGWLCAVGTLNLLLFSVPLQADDPRTPSPSEQAAPEAEKALQDHIDEHGLKVFQRVVADLDNNGQLDIAAHVARPEPEGTEERANVEDESALVVALAAAEDGQPARIAVNVPDGLICPWCPVGQNAESASKPKQNITVDNDRLEICESWGDRWFARECTTVRFDANSTLRVLQHEEASGWKTGPTEHELNFDFTKLHGERSYVSHPVETGFPVLEHSSHFAMFVAANADEAPELDGDLKDPLWNTVEQRSFGEDNLLRGKEHWNAKDDAALNLRLAWLSEGLYVAIDIKDDVVTRSSCDKPEDWVNRDRVELWLDVASSLQVAGNQQWIEDHRRVYLEDPVRHEPDNYVLSWVIVPGKNGICAEQQWPRGADGEQTVSGIARADGYTIELLIPAESFGASNLAEYEGRWFGTGFTVSVHDVDDVDRPQDATQLATSHLAWGDPFTFGILVMANGPMTLPTFPFDWAAWLE